MLQEKQTKKKIRNDYRFFLFLFLSGPILVLMLDGEIRHQLKFLFLF